MLMKFMNFMRNSHEYRCDKGFRRFLMRRRKSSRATLFYAIGSGSPGGSGISKTLSVIDTSM